MRTDLCTVSAVTYGSDDVIGHVRLVCLSSHGLVHQTFARVTLPDEIKTKLMESVAYEGRNYLLLCSS